MSEQIISTEIIKRQGQRAAEGDFKAGREIPDCPYVLGTVHAMHWYLAYLVRELELTLARDSQSTKVISTFAHGPVEQLEEMSA